MSERVQHPRVLLLQVRDHHDAEAHEKDCFGRACGLDLESWNLVSRPQIRWADAQPADVLLVGGAGRHTAREPYPFTPYLEDLLGRWIDNNRPLFASCFGHHFLATSLGGELVLDPAAEEVGTFEVGLTDVGKADPLFSDLPDSFDAQLGHHDRVAALPPKAVELASSERCPNQAMRIEGSLVYGTQFHPEMTAPEMKHRLLMYRDRYLRDDPQGFELTMRLRHSREASTLLRRFLELVDIA